MTYKASPERFAILRLLVRLVLCLGAIVALWLIAPTAANALEPPAALDDTVTDATTDVVDTIDAEITVTEAAEELTDTVTDAADSAVTPVIDPVEEPIDTVKVVADFDGRVDPTTKAISSATRDVPGSARGAGASVGDIADDAVPIVEGAGRGATDVARQLQDAVSTVDPGVISAVEATAEFTTAVVATVPRIDIDGMAMPGDGEHVMSLPLEEEPALTIRGPPVTAEPIAAAATSDARVAAPSASVGAPKAPATPDGIPPATGSTTSGSLRDGSSLDDLAAILAAILIALGLVRSSWRVAELRYSPIFLSLAERPG